MVGSAILRRLRAEGYSHLITRSREALDLCDQRAVRQFFADQRIDHVVLAAARVGGIYATNTSRAEFIHENLAIELNVIHEAYRAGVHRLLFLGSSCIYPKAAPQPLKEEYLLTGPLESTNEPYAVAKIAGIKLCESYNRQYGTQFRAVMPTNLYGPGDNYDLKTSHVLPALIRKFHLARLAGAGDIGGIQRDQDVYGPIPEDTLNALGLDRSTLEPTGRPAASPKVIIWGSGSPRREFLHVDDMADACFFVMNLPDGMFGNVPGDPEVGFLNVGCGDDLTIRQLAEAIAAVVGYRGEITWDRTQPDGTPRKLMDVSRLTKLGWTARIPLEEGIRRTYQEYLKQILF